MNSKILALLCAVTLVWVACQKRPGSEEGDQCKNFCAEGYECVNEQCLPSGAGASCENECAKGFRCDTKAKQCVTHAEDAGLGPEDAARADAMICGNGDQRSCSTGMGGSCEMGTQNCLSNSWGACAPPSGGAEICDGEDNDCNNAADEGLCPAGQSCVSATRICTANGAASSCGNYPQHSLDTSTLAEMCTVEEGDYDLGATPTTVHLGTFFLDRYEVTNARYGGYWAALSGVDQIAATPACSGGFREWSSRPDQNAALQDHPVVCVTRAQAEAFCAWAHKRLPTAVEWEAAARGSVDTRDYPWGAYADGKANCDDSSCHDVYPQDTCETGLTTCPDTAPVSTLSGGATPTGFRHMAGNVAEWVLVSGSTNHYYRGGSWYDVRADLTVWSQSSFPDSRNYIGFRCVADENE